MTTIENNEKKTYVSFHIGRNHSTHNAGHLTFSGEEDFQDLISRCSDVCSIIDADPEGNTLPDEEWTLIDQAGNTILEGRDEIEAMEGCLEWDGVYNTDYVTTTDKLDKKEIAALWKAYEDGEYMSDELKDTACSLMGLKRVYEIRRYPSNLTIFSQEGVDHISIDEMAGELTREEWEERLEEDRYCPQSIEKIIDKLEMLEVIQ